MTSLELPAQRLLSQQLLGASTAGRSPSLSSWSSCIWWVSLAPGSFEPSSSSRRECGNSEETILPKFSLHWASRALICRTVPLSFLTILWLHGGKLTGFTFLHQETSRRWSCFFFQGCLWDARPFKSSLKSRHCHCGEIIHFFLLEGAHAHLLFFTWLLPPVEGQSLSGSRTLWNHLLSHLSDSTQRMVLFLKPDLIYLGNSQQPPYSAL